MDRLHELERFAAYGAILLAAGWLDLGPRRTLLFGGLALIGALGALYRFVKRAEHLRYAASIYDMLFAPAAAGAATGSFAVIGLTTFVVAGAMLIVYEKKDVPTLVFSSAGLLLALGLAAQLAVVSPMPGSAPETAVKAVIAILSFGVVAIAATLGLWWRLRSELEEREEDLAAVLDAAPVVVGRVDASGLIRYVSGDTEGRFGATGDGPGRIPERLMEAIACAHSREAAQEVELDGRIFTVSAVRKESEDVVFTASDITEIAAANRRLESLVRSKDEFVASISHELRTPLTSVLGSALELSDRLPEVGIERELLSMVAGESEEMAAIIEDLLVAARADLGTLAISLEPVDLNAVVEWTESSVTGITPVIEPRTVFVDADPIRLRQIVRNLLTNAMRYGGPEIRVRCFPTAEAGVLEVADEGPEIESAEAARIFEAYVSAGASGGQPAAVGLGLSLSRELARLMAGRLMYRHEGGWNIFRLELPISSEVAHVGGGHVAVSA